MEEYDPEIAPDPAEWLEIDEQLRMMVIEDFHRKAKIDVPGIEMHAIIHAIVENQLAEGVASAVDAMARLRAAGLERHEALHAIGSVLCNDIWNALDPNADGASKPSEAEYDAALKNLTAQSWLESARDD